MSHTFDAIVIGSGFGGAITACRLAEKGMKVLVLERGRRWVPREYPRKPGDPWLFSQSQPARQNGWLDLRFFKNMTVAQAAGVGGGSLAYSSVALEAHPSLFTSGWPAEITYDELKPCYDRVARDDGPADGPRWPADSALQAAPRSGGEAWPWRSLFEDSARRVVFARLELSAERSVQPTAFQNIHKRSWPAARHLHPSGKLRHRMRRQCEEHARPQLHSPGRVVRSGRTSVASGTSDRAHRHGVSGRLRPHSQHPFDSWRRERRARVSGRGQPGLDRTASPLPG